MMQKTMPRLDILFKNCQAKNTQTGSRVDGLGGLALADPIPFCT